MNNRDKKEFAEVWRACWESCGKTVTDRQLRLEFATLEPYTIEQVRAGLTAHRRDPDAGQYPPKAADVIRQVDGRKPTAERIIAAAMEPQTPLAVLCRIKIGAFDLNNRTLFELRPKAEQCIAALPEWKSRIESGNLTEHERERIAHYGADETVSRLDAGSLIESRSRNVRQIENDER